MNYLDFGSLHPKASLVTGYIKADNQMHGIDQSFLGGVFIGHARAGVAEATLNHTYVMRDVFDIRLNGESIGEIGLNALWAAYAGSALILVVGDEKTAAEAQAFEKTIQAAIVKEGISQFTAKHYSVEKACEIIAEQTKNAIELRKNDKIFAPSLPDNYVMEIDFSVSEIAHLCSFVPGVDRVAARTVRFENTDYRLLQQTRIVCTNLALATVRSHF
jgi:D-amino peptidase